MGFDGNGNFNRIHNWSEDAANGINISSSRMDEEFNDVALGLGQCLTRDGQAPMTGELDMGGNRITRVGVPANDTDAVNRKYVQDFFLPNSDSPTISGGTPGIKYKETDQVEQLRHWRTVTRNSDFVVQPLNSSATHVTSLGEAAYKRDSSGLTDVYFVGGPNWNSSAPNSSSVMTRERSDNRYLKLSGGEMTGDLDMGEKSIKNSRDFLFDQAGDKVVWGSDASQTFIRWVNGSGLQGYQGADWKFTIGTDGLVVQEVYNDTSASAANIYVNSNGRFFRSTSSGEYKINREPIHNAEEIIDAMSPITFESTHSADEGRRFAGFIAGDLAKVFPEASMDGDSNYDVRAVVAALTEYVKQLKVRVANLESA